MSDFKAPGVYISESLAAPQADVGVSLSNGCFVGPHARGPLAVDPTRPITSFQQFVNLYGGFDSPDDLTYAAYQFFNNGGRQCFIARVTDGSETTSTAALNDQEAGTPQPTLTVDAANPGAWGNAISVAITPSALDNERFTLTVYSGGVAAANVVERFMDLTMDNTDTRYVAAVVNSPVNGSIYVTVTDAGLLAADALLTLADVTPAPTGTGTGPTFVVVPVTLTGGADAAGAPADTDWDAALAQVDAIDSPVTLNLPGVTTTTLINKALAYANTRGDVFIVIDGITAVGVTPPTVADQITAANAYTATNTSYGAVYFPRPRIADPASRIVGATKVVPAGGAVVGLFVANDAAAGVQKTPAGVGTRIANAVGLEVTLSSSDLDTLNVSNVNAIRSLPGAGIVVFGGRTLTKTGKADKYISVRRSLILLKAEMEALCQFAVFESNDYLLWQQIANVLDQYLMGFWSTGGLVGDTASEAFYVTCDDTNNTPQTVGNGETHVDVGVALQKPAEFVGIRVSQFDGTVSVAEAA
jgi:uncharacterized protein